MQQLQRQNQVRIKLERSPDTQENLDNLTKAFLAATKAIKEYECKVYLNSNDCEFIITKPNN